MLNKHRFTRVPRYIVIISAYGFLESPKSATFALKVPFVYVTNTLRLFKSRWIIGGFISCKASIPLAISRARDNLCFQDNWIELAFLCRRSKRLP